MSFIIVAKGKQAIFFATELAWTVVSLGLAWLCVRSFGLKGAGIAFFGSYACYALLLYPTVRGLSGFRWSTANKQTGLLFLSLIAVVFFGFYVLPLILAACLGTLTALLSFAYSIRLLFTLVPWDQVPRLVRRLLAGFGFAPSGSAGVA
jgi:PST family polysaccharide transporter